MKNAISEVWLIGLMVLFIMSFTGFLAVTINYSRAFKVKDMALTKIETHRGVTNIVPSACSGGSGNYCNEGTLQAINAYLVGNGYKIRGKCPGSDTGTWYGASDLSFTSSVSFNTVSPGNTYFYCLSKHKTLINDAGGTQSNSVYFKIRLFYKLELPVLGDIFTFDVDGRTNPIMNPANDTMAMSP